MTEGRMGGEVLSVLDALPAGFLEVGAEDLYTVLSGATLIRLSGRHEPALFVSVLLHGNEPVGLKAAQLVLRRYQDRELPRGMFLFIGNVRAAHDGVRRLDGQPDYNRVWPGWEEDRNGQHLAGVGQSTVPTPEHAMAARVTRMMRETGVFASVDIHNNTGLNPHYACINVRAQPFYHLATLFSRTVVYFVRPKGVLSAAFAEFCPSITVECGKPDSEAGVHHAADFIEACLHLSQIPEHPVARHDMDLFHTVAQVKVPSEVAFAFGANEADLIFPEDLDRLNFLELASGTPIAKVNGRGPCLEVRDERGDDAFDRYFRVSDGRLLTRRPVMPSMLTLDARIIRQDCLCYLMERL
jgi:hypothetical protein